VYIWDADELVMSHFPHNCLEPTRMKTSCPSLRNRWMSHIPHIYMYIYAYVCILDEWDMSPHMYMYIYAYVCILDKRDMSPHIYSRSHLKWHFRMLFQSSRLKARTSLFTEMWQKRPSSFELSAFEIVTPSGIGCTGKFMHMYVHLMNETYPHIYTCVFMHMYVYLYVHTCIYT